MYDEAVKYVVTFILQIMATWAVAWLYWPKLKKDLRKEYHSRFNEQRWKAYAEYTQVMRQLIESYSDVVEPDPRGRFRPLAAAATSLWLVGSEPVLAAVADLGRISQEKAAKHSTNKDVLPQIREIVQRMRRDLGSEGPEPTFEDMWAPIICDADDWNQA